MTDRELLEKAAKAAGIHTKWNEAYQYMHCYTSATHAEWIGTWNPLANDGDALRLAAGLHIEVEYYEGYGEVQATPYASLVDKAIVEFTSDRTADTRRAIVKAAAAMAEGE